MDNNTPNNTADNGGSKSARFKFINDSYQPTGDSAVLAQSVTDIGLTLETVKLLTSGGFSTVSDLCKCQMRHLYRVRNIGKKHVFEVLRKLQSMGLDFMRVQKIESTEVETCVDNAESKREVKQPERQDKKPKHDKNRDRKMQDKQRDKVAQSGEKAVRDARHVERVDRTEKPANNIDRHARAEQKQEPLGKKNKKAKQEKRQSQQKENEPKRIKVNTYELDVTPVSNISKTKKLREERNSKVARLINSLPPIKNEDGLYKFFKHGKWGYKDAQGKVVIEPTYHEAFNFHEGMACVELDERCGFINTAGEVVIPIKYDTACSFSEGLASVTKDNKCGYIDKTGEVVFPFEYEAATAFENGVALVKKDGKWGYMDRQTGEIRLR